MATLWSCPKSDCPPTEIAPVDIPESGEAAGAESEPPFTTDEVAALLSMHVSQAGRLEEETLQRSASSEYSLVKAERLSPYESLWVDSPEAPADSAGSASTSI